MENETPLERWLDRALARAVTPRGGAAVIAVITTLATVGFGLLMTAVDHKNFTTVGEGLWWSVQTVTTERCLSLSASRDAKNRVGREPRVG